MKLTGTAEEIITAIERDHPEVRRVLAETKAAVPQKKRQISEYQGAALYALAKQYDGGRILEIGTFLGYSATLLSRAAPKARIVTLNPREDEMALARQFLRPCANVTPVAQKSWDYLAEFEGKPFDMIWVDGDHARIALDLPWWKHLRTGGLFLHHDYSPAGSWRPCPVVFDALNEFAARLGRELDVLVVDDGGVGLAGFYKKEGE